MSLLESSLLSLNRRVRNQRRLQLLFMLAATVSAGCVYLLLMWWPDEVALAASSVAERIGTVGFAGAALASTLLASVAFFYLQGAQRRKPTEIEIDNIRALRAEVHTLRYETRQLDQKVTATASSSAWTTGDREAMKAALINQTGKEVIRTIFSEETQELGPKVAQQSVVKNLAEVSAPLIQRLQTETGVLRTRANLSLGIGLGITSLGLWLLYTVVEMVELNQPSITGLAGPSSAQDLLRHLVIPLIPRVSLVIFIEIFAYFFLRLYKESLAESKYFQNELTNVQMKILALQVGVESDCRDATAQALSVISQTERNFVLQKGQTTVEIEKMRHQVPTQRALLEAFPRLIRRGRRA